MHRNLDRRNKFSYQLLVIIGFSLLSGLGATFVIFTSYFVLSKIRATAEFFDRKLAASGKRQ